MTLTAITDKLITFLVSIALGLTGLAYAGITTRLGILEQDKKEMAQVAKAIEIQTAVMTQQIEAVQESTKEIVSRLDLMDTTQRETAEKLNAVMLVLNQNARTYRDAMKHWFELTDRGAKR